MYTKFTEEHSQNVATFYNTIAKSYDKLKRRNAYYHQQIAKLYTFIIPPKSRVIEIGCGTADLLASVHPSYAVGIDISEEMIAIAKKKYPQIRFFTSAPLRETFDYIILSDLVGILEDIQQTFTQLHKSATDETRMIITFTNYLWEPVLSFAAKIGLKVSQPQGSWLSKKDIINILDLSDWDVVKESSYLLIPFYIPFISSFVNKYVARLPLVKSFNFVEYLIVRKRSEKTQRDYTVSIILPARNEEGNIEKAIQTLPKLGKKTQIIFVEDHSTDNTIKVIKAMVKKYKEKDIGYYVQKNEYGKAAAVRRGFANATGDVLMVFDSDLTTDAADLPKFYAALKDRKAELVMGSRLVYPMEKQAMRTLNILGNKFFSTVFSYLLDQRIKDTLCGTKVLFKKDYEKIVANRLYFGDFDPFGDFDLLFGASKLNLTIGEIPIRYKARVYGKSNIHRFLHGWLLFQMTLFAARKIKFF